jgi:predicted DNA-binding protein (MmcQ/YjbR family)
MNVETIREYILQKALVTEGFPFGEDTLVFKVKGKIFLLISLSASPLQFNVKCDPEKAIELREEYPENIIPGYHMNKKHWNTVITGNSISSKLIFEMLDDSYRLVAKIK